MWVSNSGSDDVTLLNGDGATLGTFSVGASPQDIAFEGANVWIANHDSNTLRRL